MRCSNVDQDLRKVCTEMRHTLREALSRVRLKRSLSQNFMRSCRLGALFAKHVSKFKPRSILEIGAGAGLLTLFLAVTGAKVIAVEIDPRLTPLLRGNVSAFPNVFPLEADGVLIVKASAVRADGMVANTPYKVSGPLIAAFIKSRLGWAVLTLQEEVALKLTARPGSRNYGKISVLTQLFCSVRVCERVLPKEFIPEPDVNSRIVVMVRKREWKPEYSGFEAFLKCVFAQRRKLAYKVIRRCAHALQKEVCGDSIACLKGRGVRVYELDPEEILRTYLNLTKLPTDSS